MSPLKKPKISRNSLSRASGPQQPVPGEPGQAPTQVGDAMIRNVFFILNQHVIYSVHALSRQVRNLPRPKLGLLRTFFSALLTMVNRRWRFSVEKPSTFFSRLFFVLTTSALTQPAPTAGRLNRRTPCVSGKLAQPALNIRPAASTPLATLFSPSLHLSFSHSLIPSFPPQSSRTDPSPLRHGTAGGCSRGCRLCGWFR